MHDPLTVLFLRLIRIGYLTLIQRFFSLLAFVVNNLTAFYDLKKNNTKYKSIFFLFRGLIKLNIESIK